MYGLVNQAIKDLVVNQFGEPAWLKICAQAQTSPADYVSMQYYPDSLTYGLVGSASQVLSLPADKILTEFGKYWILYTANKGYGPLMQSFGEDFKSCLYNLNNLHARMGMTMPQLNPPRFKVSEPSESVFQIEYYSERQGLSPMMMGLLEGLATRYKIKVQIEAFEDPTAKAKKIFQIKVLSS